MQITIKLLDETNVLIAHIAGFGIVTAIVGLLPDIRLIWLVSYVPKVFNI